MNKFNRENPIIGMEMLARLALLYAASGICQWKRVNFYIANDTAANTLIRGDCTDPVIAAMIESFWKQADQLSLDARIGRVGSEVNPADPPTRHKKLHFPILRQVQFNSIFKLMCTTILNKAT